MPGRFKYLPLSRNRARDSAHATLRAPGERANVQLKTWHILCRQRDSPERVTTVVRATTTLIT